MATVEALITAEEYGRMPDNGRPTELVRGRIVEMNMPYPRHGQICSKIDRILGAFVDEHRLGHLVTNDAGIITERHPDTVRGADVAFYSFARVPPGPFPRGYLAVMPEVVFEVRSPGDRWVEILAKVAEYLRAGVKAVCVLDETTQTARVYQAEEAEQVFQANDELILPEPLAGFRVAVRRFFE